MQKYGIPYKTIWNTVLLSPWSIVHLFADETQFNHFIVHAGA